MEKEFICQNWNDEPPIYCGGCSCVKIHNEETKNYFERNNMCYLYEPIEVDEELKNKIFEENSRSIFYCDRCQDLEFLDCICDDIDFEEEDLL